jgi:hypothetical protein
MLQTFLPELTNILLNPVSIKLYTGVGVYTLSISKYLLLFSIEMN